VGTSGHSTAGITRCAPWGTVRAYRSHAALRRIIWANAQFLARFLSIPAGSSFGLTSKLSIRLWWNSQWACAQSFHIWRRVALDTRIISILQIKDAARPQNRPMLRRNAQTRAMVQGRRQRRPARLLNLAQTAPETGVPGPCPRHRPRIWQFQQNRKFDRIRNRVNDGAPGPWHYQRPWPPGP